MKKRYIFVLLKGDKPIATYIGDCELPPEVINHEFSTRQMRQILAQYGYTLQRRV